MKFCSLKSKDGTTSCKCTVCLKRFLSKTNLEKHTILHHISYKECIECNECFDLDEAFDSHVCSGQPKMKHIVDHIDTMEKLQSFKLNANLNARSRSMKIKKFTAKKHCYCIQCLQGFKNRDSFYEHVNLKQCPNMKDNGQCMLCKQLFNSLDNLKDHVMTCFKDSLVSLLRPHAKNDVGISGPNTRAVYHCVRCNTLFPSSHTFRIHNKIKHNKREKYTCLKCNFNCFSRNLFKRHIRRKECPAVRSYLCFICDQNRIQYPAFGCLSTLLAHIRSHKNEAQNKRKHTELMPAKIQNSAGQVILLTVQPDDLIKVSDGKIAVCDVPKFGKFHISVNGIPPSQYVSAKKISPLDAIKESVTVADGMTLCKDENLDNELQRMNVNKLFVSVTKLEYDSCNKLTCFACLNVLPNEKSILLHFRNIHNWRMVQLSVCRSCNMAFKGADMCDEHQETCNVAYVKQRKCNCDECLAVIQAKSIPSKIDKQYTCSVCSANFSCKKSLIIHYAKHPTLVFVCEHCDTPFVTFEMLCKHSKDIHSLSEKQMKDLSLNIVSINESCHICKKKFKYIKSHVASHLFLMLECYQCNVKVSNKLTLVKHFESVHGEKWSNLNESWVNSIEESALQNILQKIYWNRNSNQKAASDNLSTSKNLFYLFLFILSSLFYF